MFVRYRTGAFQETPCPAGDKRPRRSSRRGAKNERGAALVEFALVIPMMCIMVFGMASFGFLFNEFLSVTEATNVGGQQLALARGTYADPCQQVGNDVLVASPYLVSSNTAFVFNFNGTSYSFAKGVAPTCTSMYATLNAVTTGTVYPVSLTVTYSCPGAIAFNFGTLYKFNPLPAASCTLSSQITEILQ